MHCRRLWYKTEPFCTPEHSSSESNAEKQTNFALCSRATWQQKCCMVSHWRLYICNARAQKLREKETIHVRHAQICSPSFIAMHYEFIPLKHHIRTRERHSYAARHVYTWYGQSLIIWLVALDTPGRTSASFTVRVLRTLNCIIRQQGLALIPFSK